MTDVIAAAAEAARDKIALIHHPAALLLFDTLADRLSQYAALCGGERKVSTWTPKVDTVKVLI